MFKVYNTLLIPFFVYLPESIINGTYEIERTPDFRFGQSWLFIIINRLNKNITNLKTSFSDNGRSEQSINRSNNKTVSVVTVFLFKTTKALPVKPKLS